MNEHSFPSTDAHSPLSTSLPHYAASQRWLAGSPPRDGSVIIVVAMLKMPGEMRGSAWIGATRWLGSEWAVNLESNAPLSRVWGRGTRLEIHRWLPWPAGL